MTRRKLLGMLDQYKWRRKEINNFFLPKTRQERLVAKQRFASQHGRKDVAHKAAAGVGALQLSATQRLCNCSPCTSVAWYANGWVS